MKQIELKNVSYIYQENTMFSSTALFDVNVTIQQGEFVGIIGHSGSGKSTFAQLIKGLVAPTAGSVVIDGVQTDGKNVLQQVGLVFQYPEQQLFGETVGEDIAFGPKNFGYEESKLPELVSDSLTHVGLDPAVYSERSPYSLSGGQKRRVAIAGIIVMNPDILIFDEPTAGLDIKGCNWIKNLALAYHQQGKTVLWISHNMAEVAEIAQRVLVLSQGHLMLDDTPDHVFDQEQQLIELGLDIPAVAKVVRCLVQEGKPLLGQAVTCDAAYLEIVTWLKGAEYR